MQPTDLGAPNGDTTPSIQIVSPKDGDTIYGNKIDVVVQVTNLAIDTNTHLHIYLDGRLASMAFTTKATLINVDPGIHDICAVVADKNHVDSSLRDGVTIDLEAAQHNP